jgi:hypothetical protein
VRDAEILIRARPHALKWAGLGIGGASSCETGLERLGEVGANGVAGAPPSIGGWVGLGIGGSSSCETGFERLGEVGASGVAGAPPSIGGWVRLGIGGSSSGETGFERLGKVRANGVAGAPPSTGPIQQTSLSARVYPAMDPRGGSNLKKADPRRVQPPDAENRTSGGVEGLRGTSHRSPIRSIRVVCEGGWS